ncbi:hypothetical protein K1719_003082 [Acacia pycnantha]|nr:hypothetical protein K1719_003082 [Acacia pycnantha]
MGFWLSADSENSGSIVSSIAWASPNFTFLVFCAFPGCGGVPKSYSLRWWLILFAIKWVTVREWLPPLPSLVRHFCGMIQQWLDIPSSDILVVLSQSGGSNKGGFTIVSSNTKSSIHLDGVFNIISYDLVPKLQSMLMASDFKVRAI